MEPSVAQTLQEEYAHIAALLAFPAKLLMYLIALLAPTIHICLMDSAIPTVQLGTIQTLVCGSALFV